MQHAAHAHRSQTQKARPSWPQGHQDLSPHPLCAPERPPALPAASQPQSWSPSVMVKGPPSHPPAGAPQVWGSCSRPSDGWIWREARLSHHFPSKQLADACWGLLAHWQEARLPHRPLEDQAWGRPGEQPSVSVIAGARVRSRDTTALHSTTS